MNSLQPALSRDDANGRQEPRPSTPAKPPRLVSLDAYRGFIMLLMASGGLAIEEVARNFPNNHTWETLSFQTEHVSWVGGTLMDLFRHTPQSEEVNHLGGWFGGSFWDLIQPSFMFMVGVAMPYSYAARRARGDSTFKIWMHVLIRSFILIALGIFLRSKSGSMTNFTFEDVLTQIGLGYAFVFLVLGRGLVVQFLALIAVLGGYWAYFAAYPLPPEGFDYSSVGVPNGPLLTGFFQHWDKNTNAAHWFDVIFLNLFARPNPWQFNGGGYLTLSFVPSMGTAIIGVMAGEMLRGSLSKSAKFTFLVLAGGACLATGILANETICPIIKRIWTPSWALYSAGWTLLLLAVFYGVIDGIGLKRWAFPFVVVGMNSIAMYCMAGLIAGWVRGSLKIHLNWSGKRVLEWINAWLPEASQLTMTKDWYSVAGIYGPILQSATVLLVLWLICLWMYRRGIFLRV